MRNSYCNSGPDNRKGPSTLTICGVYLGGVNANRADPTAILYP